jgi:hypothetical protein
MERDLFTLQRKLESSSSEVITESSRDPLSLYPFKGTLHSRETFVHDKAMERDLFTLQRKLESQSAEGTTESRDPLSFFFFYPFKGTLYSRETFVHDKAMERDLFTLRTKLGS